MSNAESNSGTPQTFWDHLEELRGCILRMLAAAAAAAAAAFGFKEELFGIVLAPADPDFITYRILGAEPFKFQLINTGLTEQFMIHLKTALAAGLLIASPYILYLLFRFVSPALYDNERRYSVSITLWAYAMFLMGVAVNYFVVFTPIRDKIAISCMLRQIHEFSSHAIRHGLYIKNRKRLFCP